MISVLRPKTQKELFEILDKEDKSFVFIAGGTDVMPSVKKGIEKRKDFIDLSFLKKELSGVELKNNEVIIKSLTTFAAIQRHELVTKNFPAFLKAAKMIGGFTIQSMATIAGNIVNASPAADSLPPLLTLNSRVTLLSSNGERVVELKDFYTGYKQMEIKNNEIISNIIIPISNYKSEFIEIGTRKAMSITKVSLAYSYKAKDIRLSAGSSFAYPTRLLEVEKGFFNDNLTKKDFRVLLKKDVSPLDDIRSTGKYRFNVLVNILFNLYQEIK